ncbi:CHASE2 domain-containing protein [Catenovulum sediminis]|uniref:Adenylate/guanylate cyclase domain-containing protein n=1 Tax=Catenovulum sediminis TaxID=1740262 RepID=A0ABV1RD85_9ALTE|nr:adenylate/guanylate cyclase domain-containing protein [Catenovulum sediminis]
MFKISPRKLAVLLGLLFTSLFISIQMSQPASDLRQELNKLDGLLYDARFHYLLAYRQKHQETNIVIIDIDEKSMRSEGRFPWSRRKTAELVDKLFAAGVAVIAFDVMFSEPEENPIETILQNNAENDILGQLLAPIKQNFDADKTLAQSISQGDVILGVLFEDQMIAMSGQLPGSHVTTVEEVPIESVTAIAKPAFIGVTDTLYQATLESGFIISQGFMNSTPDDDGSIRRAALVMRHKNQLYASLALEAVRAYLFEEQITVVTEPHGKQNNITAIMLNKQRIATDLNGRVLVPYRGGKGSFPYISATDVLKQKVDPQQLAGAIAFVGTSAVGLADLRETPVGLQYPGVEVHANVAEALLHPDILKYRPDTADDLVALYLLIIGVLLSIFMPRLGSVQMALGGTLILAVTIVLNMSLWHYWDAVLPLVTPIGLILVLTILNVAIGYMAESNQKKVIKSFFDQYVPPAHIDKMLNDPSSVSFDGERKVMSVLFSDIRSFTSISERLSASELKQLLNRYFSPITKCILDHKGTIDKYVGDMVMAFWGAPLDDERHAHNAISASFEMLHITAALNQEFQKEDWPEIKIGIGINTGEMNVGDMGSEFRRAYTVLGDAVNLGSRLEGLTKYYGVALLVSESTKMQADKFAYRTIDRVKVKGKNQAVAIFEPICLLSELSTEQQQELDLHEAAYRKYLKQDWAEAETQFKKLQIEYPQRLLYAEYLSRIKELKHASYIEGWDGSYTHTSK